jgi:chlorobactene glucosyltransferase
VSWLLNALCLCSDAVLLGLLANLIVNLRCVRRLEPRPRPGSQAKCPLVSVLVPARNEEHRIAPCLRSLAEQDYPNLEIIVLDDQSEDATARIAESLGFSAEAGARKCLRAGLPLPPGWTGKAWACHQLAQAAHGDFLLFTDADTVHGRACVSTAIAHAEDTRADLLTLWPYQITGTWSEILVIPLQFVAAGAVLPHWLLALAQRYPAVARLLGPAQLRSLGAASGQFLLFRRESYFAFGGHRAVAGHLVEDVALAREIARRTANGLRLVSANGTCLVRCRMYNSFPEMWEGFTKNLHPLFEGDELLFMAAIVGQAMLFIWPFVICGWWRSPALLVQLALIYGLRTATAWIYRSSFWSVLLHPVGYTLGLLIAVNSCRCTSGKGVTWKGRRYQTATKMTASHADINS